MQTLHNNLRDVQNALQDCFLVLLELLLAVYVRWDLSKISVMPLNASCAMQEPLQASHNLRVVLNALQDCSLMLLELLLALHVLWELFKISVMPLHASCAIQELLQTLHNL